jgi:hypothetical protein
MREQFPEFNKPSKEEFQKMWDEAVFIFDTNVLLNLYRLPQSARKELLSILEKLKENVWMPHQVAKEYYKNRKEIIQEQKKAYQEINDFFESTEKNIQEKLKNHSRHPFIDCDKIFEKISGVLKTVQEEIKKTNDNHPDLLKEDTVEIELNEIFKEKLGLPFDEIQILEIYRLGEDRYKKEVPPGYKDKNKDAKDKTGTQKFGDLIIWFQIIEKAKTSKKPIIFITDERKEDWWWKIGEKTIGARHELIREIKDQANVDFHLYQIDKFLEHANRHLSVKISKEAIDVVKQITEAAILQRELVKMIVDNLNVSVSGLTTSSLSLKDTLASLASDIAPDTSSAFEPTKPSSEKSSDSQTDDGLKK